MIYNRQKLLLQVINFLSEKNICYKTYIVKSLFLLRQRFGNVIGYEFFPYHYGPFSNIIYSDFAALEGKRLFDEHKLRLTKKGLCFINELKKEEDVLSGLEEIVLRFPNCAKITDFVYNNYPEFTVKSITAKKQLRSRNGIYSIGYEGKTIDGFLNELIQNNISLLVDVRKNALSMKKGFSKNQLKNYLNRAGIDYLHSAELGIESSKRKNLSSMNDYKKLFEAYMKELPLKRKKINEIKKLGKTKRIALMCFEANKNFCHRKTLSDFLNCGVVHL